MWKAQMQGRGYLSQVKASLGARGQKNREVGLSCYAKAAHTQKGWDETQN